MGLLWCSRGKPALLSGPDAERSGLCCVTDPAQDGKGRIDPLSPRGLEAKICGSACGCMCGGALSRLPPSQGDVGLVYR